MKTIFFGNGALACDVLEMMMRSGDLPCAVILHPTEKARERDRLLALAEKSGACVVDGSTLRDPSVVKQIADMKPELGVSVMFGFILRQELLDVFPRGVVNLHPSYLPFNRGAHPNVWSIVEGTPAGVTLHEIDAGVDTGAILAQCQVPVTSTDTAATLYTRLIENAREMFSEVWPMLKEGKLKPMKQEGEGTCHRVSDLSTLDVIDLDKPTTARAVIDQIRARTFPPYAGAYFLDRDGRKIYVSIEMTPEE